jgi:hypothetical protein
LIEINLRKQEKECSVPEHVVLGNGKYETWINSVLQFNLNIILEKAIPNNWDCVFIVFGGEGTGKTTFSSQMCLFLDSNFSHVHVVFTPEEFIEVLETSNEEDAILWDEAITGASTATQANKLSFFIVSQLTQIRKKKLKLFFCFPYLNMLNKYFVMRSRGGFYIYAKGFDKRGYGRFYSQQRLSLLYGFMKEKYNYYPNQAIKHINSNFRFKFSKLMCFDEKIYDEKKEEARKRLKEEFFGNKESERVCPHTPSEIRFVKKTGLWYCRKCGEVFEESPFGKDSVK